MRFVVGFVGLCALALLMLALRTLFVGATSFDPVLFAGLYVLLLALVAFAVVLVRTVRRTGGDYLYVLFGAALVGALVLTMLAPTIGEPNYCYFVRRHYYGISRTPPTVFRCTSLPFGVAGWFAGWGVALWFVSWRESRR